MPIVVFESMTGAAVEAHADDGARLVDICDDVRAAVPFSCRSASCGACRIEVLEGADLLEPPHADELEVLQVFGDDPTRRRLACQARVRPGAGRLRLRAANPY